MLKEEILEKLKTAIIELEDQEVNMLLQEGLQAGLPPMEMITDGLSPGLTIIVEEFESGERFMADLVIAGKIMTEATEILRPAFEAGGEPLKEYKPIISAVPRPSGSCLQRLVSGGHRRPPGSPC